MEEQGEDEREAPYEVGEEDIGYDDGCRWAKEVPLRSDDDIDARRDRDAGEEDREGPTEGSTTATRRSDGAEMGRACEDRSDVRSFNGRGCVTPSAWRLWR